MCFPKTALAIERFLLASKNLFRSVGAAGELGARVYLWGCRVVALLSSASPVLVVGGTRCCTRSCCGGACLGIQGQGSPYGCAIGISPSPGAARPIT